MKNTIHMIKNNFKRTDANRSYLVISLAILFTLVSLAVFLTSRFEIKGNIAYISASGELPDGLSSLPLNVSVLKDAPPKSRLVMNKYDAIVTGRKDGGFDITTFKSKEFVQSLEYMLTNGSVPAEDVKSVRHVGSNILGYLLMFLMLQGLFFMTYFTEDKEKKCLRRIVSSPVSVANYIFSQFVFNFIMVYIPTLLVLTVSMAIFRINGGLNFLQYAGLTAVLSLFSSAFALLLTASVEKSDNVMTFASSFVVLTSVLSGSFTTIHTGNGILKLLIGILPQKNYLTLVQGLENGRPFADVLPQLAYLLALTAAMTAAGILICGKRFRAGRY